VQLFSLPKQAIAPLVQQDGSLNLKIKFVKQVSLTASAFYLQSKIEEFKLESKLEQSSGVQ